MTNVVPRGKKLKTLVAGIAAVIMLGSTVPAHASEQPVEPVPTAPAGVVYEDELGLLVTPDELAELGATAEEIAHQAELFDDLSGAELTEQAELRTGQAELEGDLTSMPDLPSAEAPVPDPSDSGTITPYIYLAVCWPGNDYYSVFWNNAFGDAVDCFADSGMYNTIGYTRTSAVRPGNNVGRVYYPNGSYFYWSPWRGKSFDTYYFGGSGVLVQKVQISA